ncbi:MAG: MFS transporter [Firmicutes bacterium]|nr:MFS transporter [Bacillota bacterium]
MDHGEDSIFDHSESTTHVLMIRSFFHAFSFREYRWLWVITTLTNSASWTFTLIVTWQAYALTHSSTWSGAVMFATLIPNIVGAPIAGVLADLMDRRVLMLFACVIEVAVTVVLSVLTQFHHIDPAGLLVLTLLFGFASSALSVMLSSLVPAVVPEERLFNALSLQAVAQRGTEFVGPALASPLLIIYGPGVAYLLATLFYVLSAAAVFLLSKVDVHAAPDADSTKRHVFAPLLDGFTYVRKNRTIGLLVSLVGLHCALTMAYMGMLPQYVKVTLHSSTVFYGVVVSAIGLGSILGTLLLAGVKDVGFRGMLYWITALLSGGSLVFFALSRSPSLALLAIVLVGASQAVFMTLSLGYIQQLSVKHMTGRVTSFYLVLAGGFMSLANLAYGSLSTVVAPDWIMGLTGMLFMLVVGIYGLSSAQFRTVWRSGAFIPRGGDTPTVSS